MLNAEMDHHLDAGEGDGNRRNGYVKKTVLTDTGRIPLEVPRADDRTAEPGVGGRHHLHPDGPRLSVSGGDHRLVLACGVGMAAVEHDRRHVLRRSAGGGAGLEPGHLCRVTLLPDSGPVGKVPTDLEGSDDEADEAAVFAGTRSRRLRAFWRRGRRRRVLRLSLG